MGIILTYDEGQTPLNEEEREGLLIPAITTRGELDEFEQLNIEKAVEWTLKRRFKPEQMLTEQFVMGLHKRMFDDVWRWAGTFRNSNKNLGVDRFLIATELRKLLDDTRFWIDHEIYSPEEIVIRFKHRIVTVHCFANGNGRHSRLIADMLIYNLFALPVYSWGSLTITEGNELRNAYLTAIKQADNGEMQALIAFSRS